MAGVAKSIKIKGPVFKTIEINVSLARSTYYRLYWGVFFIKLGCKIIGCKVNIEYDCLP